MTTNKKSDLKAKQAFIGVLKNNGFNSAKIISAPADIEAWKDGVRYYFEIKMTKQSKTYFGAATLTEWQSAMANPGNYFFVLALTDTDETRFEFKVLTPEQFMGYSSIPPFKIFFNISLLDLLNSVNKKHELDTEIYFSEISDNESKFVDETYIQIKNTEKKARKQATKLSNENIEKMILLYNELINDQLQKDKK